MTQRPPGGSRRHPLGAADQRGHRSRRGPPDRPPAARAARPPGRAVASDGGRRALGALHPDHHPRARRARGAEPRLAREQAAAGAVGAPAPDDSCRRRKRRCFLPRQSVSPSCCSARSADWTASRCAGSVWRCAMSSSQQAAAGRRTRCSRPPCRPTTASPSSISRPRGRPAGWLARSLARCVPRPRRRTRSRSSSGSPGIAAGSRAPGSSSRAAPVCSATRPTITSTAWSRCSRAARNYVERSPHRDADRVPRRAARDRRARRQPRAPFDLRLRDRLHPDRGHRRRVRCRRRRRRAGGRLAQPPAARVAAAPAGPGRRRRRPARSPTSTSAAPC